MSAPARFGRLARAYRWMEYLSFGRSLERCRSLRLGEMLAAGNVLILGDGDGRFVAGLASAAPQMTITAIDASERMLRQAERRLAAHARLNAGWNARVTLCHADVRNGIARDAAPDSPGGGAPYDLIVSHFFLDCFHDNEIAMVLEQVGAVAGEGAVWVVSEFAVPDGRVSGVAARMVGRIVIGGLYLCFRLLTGLRTRRLPDYSAAMRGAGWLREDKRQMLGGLLVSERWRHTGRS